MLTIGEIKSMQDALTAYVGRIDRTKAARAQLGIFDPPSEYDRFNTIVADQVANLDKFKARRNDLINAEPSDHEAVLQFVTDLRALAADDTLPAAMRREAASNDVANIVGGAVKDTVSDIGFGIGISIPVLMIGALLFLVATGKVKV